MDQVSCQREWHWFSYSLDLAWRLTWSSLFVPKRKPEAVSRLALVGFPAVGPFLWRRARAVLLTSAGRFVTRYSSCSVCIYLTYFKSDAVLAGLSAIVFSSFKLSSCFYSARISIWVKTLEVNWYFEVLPCQSYRESGKSKKLLVDVNYNKPIAKAATSVTIPVQLVK